MMSCESAGICGPVVSDVVLLRHRPAWATSSDGRCFERSGTAELCATGGTRPVTASVTIASMRDDDWYRPHPERPAALPRQPQPGEEVWRLRDGDTGRVQTCELRDNSRAGS